jgi:DNA polymerase I
MKAVWDFKAQFVDLQGEQVFDCMLAESFLSEGRYLPTQPVTMEKYKVATLAELAKKQQEKLAENEKMRHLYETIELPLVYVLYAMENRGILLDKACMKTIGEEIAGAIADLAETIEKVVGYEINLSSPAQVGVFLAEKAGVPLPKTKSGQYATNETELLKHKEQFPVIQQLLQYRELTKLKSTYGETLAEKADAHDRIHTTFSQVGISTGRLASSNPNLQNIPVRSVIGLKIKSCFIASPDHTLLAFDYSQQELRILAHLTGEEKLIEAFQKNQDVHRTTAAQLFDVSYDDVTKDQRMVGKTINFGIIYGMSSYGMSEGLQIPVEEAGKFINNFYKTYPKIKVFYDTYLKQGLINDYVETLLGRRRFVRQYPQQKFIDNASKRVLMNFPIQGTAAELMKMAMIKVYKDVIEQDEDIHLLLQIHDELLFEVKNSSEGKLNKYVVSIQEIMRSIYPLAVPMEVEVKIGTKWGDLKALSSQ